MAFQTFTDTDADATGRGGTVRDAAWSNTFQSRINSRWSEYAITLTGSQNNVSITDPVSGLEADVLLLNNASDLTITGFAAPASPAKPGKRLTLVSLGAGNVFLSYFSASSSAGNKIVTHVTSGLTPLKSQFGRATLVYNATSSRWELVDHEQGGWITPTFSAGDYVSSAGSTWTVASGDVGICKYWLKGTTLFVELSVTATTVSSTPATLRRTVPGGYTLAAGIFQWARVSDNGAAMAAGLAQPQSTQIYFYTTIAGTVAWANATDATIVQGSWHFEVT